MKFYYYSIYCKITGKQYIGITTNIEERWKRHISLLNSNKHHSYKLQEAWNTFGKDNFNFSIIDELETDTENAYKHEKELIEKYDSCNNGYNVLIGGQINPIYTEEVYEKMEVQTSYTSKDIMNLVPNQIKTVSKAAVVMKNLIEEGYVLKAYDGKKVIYTRAI